MMWTVTWVGPNPDWPKSQWTTAVFARRFGNYVDAAKFAASIGHAFMVRIKETETT